MTDQELLRIGRHLHERGWALTSFSMLDILQPVSLTDDLLRAVENTEQFIDANQAGRSGMLMFREEAPLVLGRRLVEPIVKSLFMDNFNVMDALGVYAINHYEVGDFFNPHQDHFDGTVMIATIIGRRRFDLYKKEPDDDVFREISDSVILDVGSILILNGYKNLGHAAACLDGPSISVVADVPFPIMNVAE